MITHNPDSDKWRIKKRKISTYIWVWCVWAPGQVTAGRTFRTWQEAVEYYVEEY